MVWQWMYDEVHDIHSAGKIEYIYTIYGMHNAAV